MNRKASLYFAFAINLIFFSLLSARDPQVKWLAKRPIIKEVKIIGNEYIEDDEIKDAISTKEQGFWQKLKLKKKSRLRKNSRQLDGAAINYLYKRNGYLDIQYEFQYKVAPDSSAIVEVILDEGERYHIGEATIPNDLGQKKEYIQKIVSQLKPGNAVNPYLIEAVASAIKTVYANEGHPYAQIDYRVIPHEDNPYKIDIEFSIDPGPLTIFGDISIDSLKYTSSRVVKRELVFEPGDLYSRKKLIESRQRIYSTGLFTYVDFEPEKHPDSLVTNPALTITGIEKKPRFLRVKTGAAQDTIYDLVWNLSLETGSRNISGLGRTFRFMPETRFQIFSGWQLIDEKFSFHYTEPWPFGFRMPLQFSFSWEPRLRRTAQDYKIERFEFTIGTLNELGRFVKIRSGFEFEKVDITGIPNDSTLQKFKRDEEINVGRSFWLSFERDSRLDIFLPTSGSVTRVTGQYYGGFLGGDKNFFKIVAEWSRYLGLSRWDVYAFRFKGGLGEGLTSDDQVPLTDRFYLGGANTIRGYKEKDVGPKTPPPESALEGGTFYFITNHEYRRYLVGKFWISLFLDVGGNWRDNKDFHFRDLLATCGMGLQYASPLGPIRFDYGQRIAWKPVDGGGRFHISILYAF